MPRLSKPGVDLRTWVNRHYPKRDKKSDGWIADAAHMAVGLSDHCPDENGIVRAIDIDADLTPGKGGASSAHRLAEMVRHEASIGARPVAYVIFAGQIASPKRGWKWRKYDGTNGHFHHIHVSFRRVEGE